VPDEKGDYARIFEEEYNDYLNEILHQENTPYIEYLKNIVVSKTHSGYFSIDKKTRHIVDPDIKKKTGEADDIGAYDLILKDKERLLSFEEPVRFIFSHSALREGWDNPNVFVICTLKNSDNTISRRQEVGRGLRLCVNQLGERIDEPDLVHRVNILTVVASESYANFVEGLQKEIVDNLAPDRLLKRANVAYFLNKTLNTIHGDICITEEIARAIYHYLIKNDYIDEKDALLPSYTEAHQMQALAVLPDKLQLYTDSIFKLINAVLFDKQLGITDQKKLKKNSLNNNFYKEEFQSLWKRINYKAHYRIQFDSEELIQKTVDILNKSLRVYSSQHLVERGMQLDRMTQEKLQNDEIFRLQEKTTIPTPHRFINMRYDLIGTLSRQTQLKRRTVANILYKIKKSQFAKFSINPENFLAEATKLINDQKSIMMIEHLTYDPSHEKFSKDIFTKNQIPQDLPISAKKLKHHIYDYLIADSNIEEDFAEELDRATEVIVYAKLPRGFYIPTPVGKHNPDWAISFKKNEVRHVYFIAETKGSQSPMELRGNEKIKVDCAKKFFDTLNKKHSTDKVKYAVVNSFDRLMQLVK
jgi:type III restriction enzyme